MKPIGILGGGQLARMLALEAHRRGLPVAVFSEQDSDPARQVVNDWSKGVPFDRPKLLAFMAKCFVVTFESEFFDDKLLSEASIATGTKVFPKPELMGLLRNRVTQKTLLDQNKLATSDWEEVGDGGEKEIRRLFEKLGGRVVFKATTGGYDGYGTFVVKNESDFLAFAKTADSQEGRVRYIAEKYVPFDRELAIIVSRDQKGKVITFPFVESRQVNSRCLWTVGPLKETKAMKAMKSDVAKFLKKIDYVGTMGIEFFETDRTLLINELAPRVHNSGHYTMDAFDFDQFAAHLFSVAALPLPNPKANGKAFAMWNLLGSDKTNGGANGELTPWKCVVDEAKLHWYEKESSRPGRKMGHVNAVGSTAKTVLAVAKKAAAKSRREIGF